jgi:hypothetical protein
VYCMYTSDEQRSFGRDPDVPRKGIDIKGLKSNRLSLCCVPCPYSRYALRPASRDRRFHFNVCDATCAESPCR